MKPGPRQERAILIVIPTTIIILTYINFSYLTEIANFDKKTGQVLVCMNTTTFKILQNSTNNADEPSIFNLPFKTGTKNFERRRLIAKTRKTNTTCPLLTCIWKKVKTINELRMKIKGGRVLSENKLANVSRQGNQL